MAEYLHEKTALLPRLDRADLYTGSSIGTYLCDDLACSHIIRSGPPRADRRPSAEELAALAAAVPHQPRHVAGVLTGSVVPDGVRCGVRGSEDIQAPAEKKVSRCGAAARGGSR